MRDPKKIAVRRCGVVVAGLENQAAMALIRADRRDSLRAI